MTHMDWDEPEDSDNYEPELGELCFGRPWAEYDLEKQFPLAAYFLEIISYIIDEIDWIRYPDRPGGWDITCGCEEVNDVFEMHPYWWGDEDDPESARANFIYLRGDKPIEVRWYKRMCRSLSTNVKMSEDEWLVLFLSCIEKVTQLYNETVENAKSI